MAISFWILVVPRSLVWLNLFLIFYLDEFDVTFLAKHFVLQSGKLVMKMFQRIQELIDDQDALICVLIDEVSALSSFHLLYLKNFLLFYFC